MLFLDLFDEWVWECDGVWEWMCCGVCLAEGEIEWDDVLVYID
jgi:hypothetical protein